MDVCPQASTSSMLCARGTNRRILELTCNETKSKSQHQNPSMLCLHHDSSHLSQRSNLLSIVLLRTFNFIPSEEKIPGDDSSRNKRDWLVSSARNTRVPFTGIRHHRKVSEIYLTIRIANFCIWGLRMVWNRRWWWDECLHIATASKMNRANCLFTRFQEDSESMDRSGRFRS